MLFQFRFQAFIYIIIFKLKYNLKLIFFKDVFAIFSRNSIYVVKSLIYNLYKILLEIAIRQINRNLDYLKVSLLVNPKGPKLR